MEEMRTRPRSLSPEVTTPLEAATPVDSERELHWLLQSARKLLENNEITLATRLYVRIVNQDANNPEALRGLGMCYQRKDRFPEAVACFERWVRLAPGPEAYAKLSAIYIKLQDEQKAIDCLQKALTAEQVTEGDKYEILNHLGNAYLKKGNGLQAERHYLDALRLRPRSDRTLVNLATLYFQRKQYEQALKAYREALSIHPENTRALSGIGLVAQEKRQWPDALKCFTLALDKDIDNLVAVHGLIFSGQQAGEFQLIETYLRRYLSKHPTNVALLYCLAGNYFHQKKWARCRDEIQKIELLDSTHEPTAELKDLLREAEAKK